MGIYFLHQWNENKAEIREVGQRVESVLKQYPALPEKGDLRAETASNADAR